MTDVDTMLLMVGHQVSKQNLEWGPEPGLVNLAARACADTSKWATGTKVAAMVSVLERAEQHNMLNVDQLRQFGEHENETVKTVAWRSARTPVDVLETAVVEQFCSGRAPNAEHWRALVENPMVCTMFARQLLDGLHYWADHGHYNPAALLGLTLAKAETSTKETIREIWQVTSGRKWITGTLTHTRSVHQRSYEICETAMLRGAISFKDVTKKGGLVLEQYLRYLDMDNSSVLDLLDEEDWVVLAETAVETRLTMKLLALKKGQKALAALAENWEEAEKILPEELKNQLNRRRQQIAFIRQETSPEELKKLAEEEDKTKDECLELAKNVNLDFEDALKLAKQLPLWAAYTARDGVEWKAGCLWVLGDKMTVALEGLLNGDIARRNQIKKELEEPVDEQAFWQDTSKACIMCLDWARGGGPSMKAKGSTTQNMFRLLQKEEWPQIPWSGMTEAGTQNPSIGEWLLQQTTEILNDKEQQTLLLGLGVGWDGTVGELLDTCKAIPAEVVS